jgi:hypothetical protein
MPELLDAVQQSRRPRASEVVLELTPASNSERLRPANIRRPRT